MQEESNPIRHGGSLRAKGRRALIFAVGMILGTALTVSGAPAQAAPAESKGGTNSGQAYYVDCVTGDDAAAGTTPQTAWRSLSRVNQVTFGPGDSILFRRGTTCTGVLQPRGSGTAAAPIVVNAYGSGPRPAIVGTGGRATVFLQNVAGWEIRHIDISNPGPADGTPRVGIYVRLEDFGIGVHYIVHDVKVHDVPGCDCLDPALENSGGILFEATGSTVPTGFDGIRVSNSDVSGVDNIGIGTLSQWSRRDLYPAGTNEFVPMRNVRFVGNTLSNLGGDGVLVMNGIDPVIEQNYVNGFGLRASQSHSAVLAYNSDRPVMQFNEVTGGASMPPSFAFTVDAGNSGLVYQYNYSHDNNGPFMLFCATNGARVDGAVVRYNISQNDRNGQFGDIEIPLVAAGCDNPVENVKFYNNVIHSTVANSLVGSYPHTSIAFTNNVFSGRPEGSSIVDSTGVYDHNLYHNVAPMPGDKNAVTGDPLFVNPLAAGADGFRLRCGSPAIDAGVVVAGNGGRDFYGSSLNDGTAPNIGAYEGACVRG